MTKQVLRLWQPVILQHHHLALPLRQIIPKYRSDMDPAQKELPAWISNRKQHLRLLRIHFCPVQVQVHTAKFCSWLVAITKSTVLWKSQRLTGKLYPKLFKMHNYIRTLHPLLSSSSVNVWTKSFNVYTDVSSIATVRTSYSCLKNKYGIYGKTYSFVCQDTNLGPGTISFFDDREPISSKL